MKRVLALPLAVVLLLVTTTVLWAQSPIVSAGLNCTYFPLVQRGGGAISAAGLMPTSEPLPSPTNQSFGLSPLGCIATPAATSAATTVPSTPQLETPDVTPTPTRIAPPTLAATITPSASPTVSPTPTATILLCTEDPACMPTPTETVTAPPTTTATATATVLPTATATATVSPTATVTNAPPTATAAPSSARLAYVSPGVLEIVRSAFSAVDGIEFYIQYDPAIVSVDVTPYAARAFACPQAELIEWNENDGTFLDMNWKQDAGTPTCTDGKSALVTYTCIGSGSAGFAFVDSTVRDKSGNLLPHVATVDIVICS